MDRPQYQLLRKVSQQGDELSLLLLYIPQNQKIETSQKSITITNNLFQFIVSHFIERLKYVLFLLPFRLTLL